ncbi:hypothetical protein BWZ20_10225 [Winogradskyella sp. J14-2]|nr:hypothetical protein BWZ20_10225 [Winogradskyella sp. J14-2]
MQPSFCQSKKADSLANLLSSTDDLKTKLQIHKEICIATYVNYPKRGLESANILLKIAKENEDKSYRFFANRYIGVFYMNQANFDSAIYYFDKNLKLYNLKIDYREAYTDLTNKGNTYRYKKERDSALFYLKKALQVAEEHKIKDKYTNIYNGIAGFYYYDNLPEKAIKYYVKAIDSSIYVNSKARLISVYNNIGNVFKDLDNYTKAIEYLDEGYNLAKRLNHKQGVADASLNLANCYNYLNINNDSIPIFFERSINLYKALSDNIFLIEAYENYGNYLSDQKQFKKAVDLKKSALDLAKTAGMEDKVFGTYVSLSNSYKDLGDIEKALKYTNLALKDTLNPKANFFENLLDLYKNKAFLEKKRGNIKTALRFQEKYSEQLQNYNNTINKTSVNEIEAKYQTEKKEKELAEQKLATQRQELLTQKANSRNWSLGSGILAAMAFIVLIYRRYKSELRAKQTITKQKDEIEKQKIKVERLQKELHHRMKNNLSFIDLFINLAKGRFEDQAYQTKLNELQNRMRSMFEVHKQLFKKDDVTSVKAKSYIDTLVRNIQEAYAKSNISISNQTSVHETILADTSFPVGLIINEFVTNSYKYAFNDDDIGVINIAIKSEGEAYHLLLKDNGKGLPKDFDINNLDSFGMDTIQLLTKEYGGAIEIDGSNGVTMNITLPKTAA